MADEGKGNVLLVDDDKFLVEMYGMKFSSGGYQVRACISVDDALEALHGGFVPDCILFDLTMPGKDGFALLKALTDEKLARGAALIALTNQGDDAEKAKAAEMGTDRYIVKATMIPSEVVTAVGEEISKKKKPPAA
jgi:DNA-binding response OmpR family regulator